MITVEQYHELIDYKKPCLIQYPNGQITSDFVINSLRGIVAVVPGSFNPLHDGHRALFYGIRDKGYFEVSIAREGKLGYTHQELNQILEQFNWYAPVIITNQPRFSDKIEIFQKAQIFPIFHVGHDCAARIVEMHSVEEIERWEGEFVVYGRKDATGTFKTLKDLPNRPSTMYEGTIRSYDNRYIDCSSTELRNRKPFLGEM